MTLGEIFTGLGYLTGATVLLLAARSRNLLTEGVLRIAGWALVGGALGAKLGEYVFEGWPFKIAPSSIFDPSDGGKALLGGLIGGWLFAVVAKRRMGITRSTGDLFAFALPAGEAIGRIGCYFNGCCYGKPTTSSFAIFQHGAWRYPTQIYSSITAALIFCCVLYVAHSVQLDSQGGFARREGDLFKIYLLLFGLSRFVIEFYRAGPTFFLGLTAMQWFCAELFVLAAFGLLLQSYKERSPGPLQPE